MNWQRVSEWFLFGVGVGSVPILADYLVHIPYHWHWTDFLARGDLFLVTAVLAGAGLGRLLISSTAPWWARGLMGFVCFVLFAVTTWHFVYFCGAGTSVDASVTGFVARMALLFFGAGAVSTSVVMGMS